MLEGSIPEQTASAIYGAQPQLASSNRNDLKILAQCLLSVFVGETHDIRVRTMLHKTENWFSRFVKVVSMRFFMLHPLGTRDFFDWLTVLKCAGFTYLCLVW